MNAPPPVSPSRSDFASSSLVRLLGEWTPSPVAVDAAGMDFAERLSLWLNTFDAIALQALHQTLPGITGAAPGAPAGAPALQADLQRVRAALAQAIAQEVLPLDPLAPAGPQYVAYQQRHGQLQHQMEQMVKALRDHVRQSLSRASARCRQLAALDAVFEQVLAPHEQRLLPTASTLLQRRFERLRRAAAADEDWLARFEQEWREALRAELDLRLEPIAGLIEALGPL